MSHTCPTCGQVVGIFGIQFRPFPEKPLILASYEWIPVDKELPELPLRDDDPVMLSGRPVPGLSYSRNVLVLIAPHNGVRIDSAARMDGTDHTFFRIYDKRVTHWMPLPPAPQGD